MEIEVQFTDQPIVVIAHRVGEETGAVLEFQGTVRNLEQGQKISALIYEIYEPMAEKIIRRILESLNAIHPCLSAKVVHRLGAVPVGEASLYIRIESRHRAEGLRLMEEFLHRLKADVPIWKIGSLPC